MSLTTMFVVPLGLLWALSEFFVYRATYSKDQEARHDQRTLSFMIHGTNVAVPLALALWWFGIGKLPWSTWYLPVVGAGLLISGLALRWTAILTLRRFFTINIAVVEGHQLITRGPYAFIRHPSYTGSLLCLCGIGLALENPLAFVLLFGIPCYGLLRRIQVEERVLRDAFGETYDAYCARTARLVPGIF